VTCFERFAACFSAELLTVLFCDNFSNADISRKLFPSTAVDFKKELLHDEYFILGSCRRCPSLAWNPVTRVDQLISCFTRIV